MRCTCIFLLLPGFVVRAVGLHENLQTEMETDSWSMFCMLINILHSVIRHPTSCFTPPDPQIGYQGARSSPTPFGSYYPAVGLSFGFFPAATAPTAPMEFANAGPSPTAVVPPTAEVQTGFPAPEVNPDQSVAVNSGSLPALENLTWKHNWHAKMTIPDNTASHIIGFGGRYIERIKTISNASTIYIKNGEATIKGTTGAITEAHRLIQERLEHYSWMKNSRWTVRANAGGDPYGSTPSPLVPRSEASSTPSVGASNVGVTTSSSAAASTPSPSVPPRSQATSTPSVGASNVGVTSSSSAAASTPSPSVPPRSEATSTLGDGHPPVAAALCI